MLNKHRKEAQMPGSVIFFPFTGANLSSKGSRRDLDCLVVASVAIRRL